MTSATVSSWSLGREASEATYWSEYKTYLDYLEVIRLIFLFKEGIALYDLKSNIIISV